MCMHTSLRGKGNRSHGKSEFQMFSLISGRHVGVPQRVTIMASLYRVWKGGSGSRITD